MRLIDANALKMEVANEYVMINDVTTILTPVGAQIFNAAIDMTLSKIREAPTIDAVQVVRCKNCMFSKKFMTGNLYCELHESYAYTVNPDGFCSRGAKMDGDAE